MCLLIDYLCGQDTLFTVDILGHLRVNVLGYAQHLICNHCSTQIIHQTKSEAAVEAACSCKIMLTYMSVGPAVLVELYLIRKSRSITTLPQWASHYNNTLCCNTFRLDKETRQWEKYGRTTEV